MSKLSDLLNRREEIARCADFFNGLPETPELEQTVEELKQQLEESQLLIDQYHTMLAEGKTTVAQFQESVNLEIDSYVRKLFGAEQKEIFKEINLEDEKIIVDQELESMIKTRISMYSSWKYPGLQLFPRSTKWIGSSVASEPLYLTQYHIGTLKNIIKEYPGIYQNRLRLYEITSSQDLIKLPTNQFSIVFGWEVFNYLSIDTIEKYMEKIFELLRPGGAFIFSYSNCDLPRSADWAELNAESYCTKTFIRQVCDKIGYNINFLKDEDLNISGKHISWAEIQRPGILHTIKAQPSMGRIISK